MKPTFADDCEEVVKLLSEGPLSLDGVCVRLKWSDRTANDVLLEMRFAGLVDLMVVRVKNKKVKQYTLRSQGQTVVN